MSDLTLALPDALIEAIARRAADLVAERVDTPQPEAYIGVAQAADYLACPKSRIYALVSAGRIPTARTGAAWCSGRPSSTPGSTREEASDREPAP